MILSYNGTPHANNECGLVITQRPYFGERGKRAGITKQITIEGRLYASTVAGITTEIEELEALYANDGGDLILYDSDGSTETAHVFRSNDTIGGLRVVSLSYPEGKGAEYSPGLGRKYEIVIEGDFGEDNENLIAWVETISETGVAGAEDWDLVPVLNGSWPRQTLSQQTPVQVVQTGKAVGQFRYPSRPPPIWPLVEKRKLRQPTKKLPDRFGDSLRNWEVGWSYTFLSMTALTGETTVP